MALSDDEPVESRRVVVDARERDTVLVVLDPTGTVIARFAGRIRAEIQYGILAAIMDDDIVYVGNTSFAWFTAPEKYSAVGSLEKEVNPDAYA